ncbi:MAG: NAD(P)H-hydrate dehydratase, partial [Magnetococcales bacterium]|nr:NAD(P)H-hydrate dehydratase [Magnetococcales bacterium]
ALTKGRKAPVVITPHPGEMSRLLATSIDQVQKDRLATALAYAVEQQVWLVLKGAATVIASPQGEAWINPTGNAALASGGSGDLLAGLLGGFLAQGWPVATAVRAAVWLHGAAADRAVAKSGPVGVTASGLLKHLRWWLNHPPFVLTGKRP